MPRFAASGTGLAGSGFAIRFSGNTVLPRHDLRRIVPYANHGIGPLVLGVGEQDVERILPSPFACLLVCCLTKRCKLLPRV